MLESCGQRTQTIPRVRLEAVRALARSANQPQAVEAALNALDKPMDRVLDYALWLTVRELEPYWMPEFKAGKLTFGGDPKKLAFALNAVGNKDAVKPVVALIDWRQGAEGEPPRAVPAARPDRRPGGNAARCWVTPVTRRVGQPDAARELIAGR